MRVLNLVWGFGIGGVAKCFLTYAGLGGQNSRLEVISVCIYPRNSSTDLERLNQAGVRVIEINGRLDFSWIKTLNSIVCSEGIDIVFAHAFNAPIAYLFATAFSRQGRKPLVCSYHSEYHPMTKARRWIAPLINATIHFVYRHYARSVLGVSNFAVRQLSNYGVPCEKLHYVYNGIPKCSDKVPLPADFPAFQPGTIVFMVASRLDEIKGLPPLLMAFARVCRKIPNIRLIVVGDGPERENLEALAKALGIEDWLNFVGYRTDVMGWLKGADVFCLPSKIESFPVGLIEAMCAGKPSIVTRVGGIPEAVTEKEVLFVNVGDVDGMQTSLERMAKDPDERAVLGMNARRRFEMNFTEEVMKKGVARWLLKQGGGNDE